MEPPALRPTQSWYTTKGGITILVILALLIALIIGFITTIGYYLWVTAYGDEVTQQTLQETFGKTFTSANGETTLGTISDIDADLNTFIRKENPTFGNPNATVTILALLDFECPFSQQGFALFETLRSRYSPAVRVVFKHFPIESIHPSAEHAAIAAQCAHEQNTFWEYYRQLFSSKELSDAALLQQAAQLGLKMDLFQRCFVSEETKAIVDQDIQDGIALGVLGTPTYFVSKKKIEGVTAENLWNQTIINALQTQ